MTKITFWLLRWLLNKSESHFLSGDLNELHRELVEDKGARYANIWLLIQIIISIPPIIGFSLQRSTSMLKNYWKIALRNMIKNRVCTFINISGFAIGIAAFILISLHITDELSYDKVFSDSNRIHRVVLKRKYPDRVKHWITTSPFMTGVLKSDYPEVEVSTKIAYVPGDITARYEEKSFLQDKVAFVDSNFFNVFNLKFVSGDRSTALRNPNSAIITEETASKYFGGDDPLGKSIQLPSSYSQTDLYIVEGVIKDLPQNIHFEANIFLSQSTIKIPPMLSWFQFWSYHTYVKLKKGTDVDTFSIKLQEIIFNYYKPTVERVFNVTYEDYLASGNGYDLLLQPLQDIHLKSHYDGEIKANGNINYVYVFGTVALLILLIGCINFTNLTTARSSNRIREIGIRKSIGSDRSQLIKQFLFESVAMSFFSMAAALGIVESVLPAFDNFTMKSLSVGYFENIFVIPGLFLFSIIVGIISGSYPAFFLTSFHPTAILKGSGTMNIKSSKLRNILVIFQFTTSIILITGTLIINSQVKYLINKDIGFDKENLLVIENAGPLKDQAEAFKNKLKEYPEILSVSGTAFFPGKAAVSGVQRLRDDNFGKAISMFGNFVDHDYIATLKMKVKEGRDFDINFKSDTLATVINESAVETFGMENPLNQALTNGGNVFFEIIGIVRDYNFQSLHSEIEPMFIVLKPGLASNFLTIRLSKGDPTEKLELIKKEWATFMDNVPMKYTYLDEDLNRYYESENRMEKISGIFSLLAIIIGCLGLFGLATFTAEQKTKDIGIRKTLGATSTSIVVLLSSEFAKLIVISVVIAFPMTYYIMREWLRTFAYSISVPFEAFVISGGITMFIALATISAQIIIAANRNPVEALKCE